MNSNLDFYLIIYKDIKISTKSMYDDYTFIYGQNYSPFNVYILVYVMFNTKEN